MTMVGHPETRRHRALRLLVPFALFFLTGRIAGACGPSEVCADISTSLTGQIDVDAIVVAWSTDSEDATVGYYAIKRYACGTPATCSVSVTTIPAAGSCEDAEPYSYEDEPPSPVGSWTYTVEVWRTNNTRACAVDVEPE